MSAALQPQSLCAQENAVLDRLAACTNLEEFVVEAMQSLPPLFGSEVTSYNEVDVSKRRVRSLIDDPQTMQLSLERIDLNQTQLLAENPLVPYHAEPGQPARRISDFITLEAWQATNIYRGLFGVVGLNHQTALVLTLEPGRMVAFAFNRRDSDFSDADLARIDLMVPHVTRLFRIAEERGAEAARAGNHNAILDRYGALWIDLDPEARVTGAAPGALEALRRALPVSSDAADALPPTILDWLASGIGAPPPPLSVDTAEGRLTASLFATTADAPMTILLDTGSKDGSPAPLEALGLSPRQAETLYWIAQGKSNVDIAVILRISPRTVETHLTRIYEVLGVSNRFEAAIEARKTLA